jgi:nicotinate-nucleotide adenylyltransferase
LTSTSVSVPSTPSTRRRIGLFGGSFDPVHQAHLALAQAALEQLQLDELRWMPAGQPWQKSRALEAGEHRAAMVALVIRSEPRFVLERCELDRAGPSYTLDSLRELQNGADGLDQADWFLLIGQDQYANFTRWHGWQQIVQRATLAVAERAGDAVAAPAELSAWLEATMEDAREGAMKDATRRTELPALHRPCHIALAPHEHAATSVRQRLGAGQSADTLTPQWLAPEVAGYIARHRLYADTPPFPSPAHP